MLIIAAFTQILIYYLGYSTLILEDGTKVSQVVPFTQYLEILFTKAHYRFGRAGVDTGEVGEFGYWIALIQFFGFIVGGVFLYLILLGRRQCQKCQKYFRLLAKNNKVFENSDDFAIYYDGIFKNAVESEDFAKMFKQRYFAKAKKGSLMLEEKLLGCPQCKVQIIDNEVQINNGTEWKDINKLSRCVSLPEHVNLVNLFRE